MDRKDNIFYEEYNTESRTKEVTPQEAPEEAIKIEQDKYGDVTEEIPKKETLGEEEKYGVSKPIRIKIKARAIQR